MKLKPLISTSIYVFCVGCIALISQGSLAQTSELAFHKYDFPDQKESLAEAKTALIIGDEQYALKAYYKALTEYEKAYQFNPKNGLLNAKLADCYLHTSDFARAIPKINDAIFLNKNLEGYYYYIKGFLEQFEGKFELAQKSYFEAEDRGTKMVKHLDELVKAGIVQCKNGTRLMNRPLDVEIYNMGENINTRNNEYIPLINYECNQLIFTSRRKNDIHEEFDYSLGDHFEELYYSVYTDEGWTVAKNMNFPLNSENHDATVSLSIDGLNMVVYRDNAEGLGNLFLAKKVGGLWFDPVPFPEPINSEFHETSACFDPQMKYIYFVSDRPGGFGGKDIYRSLLLLDETFGPAENLGPKINTAEDEDAVFLFGEFGEQMYFNSKGHGGMGGYDVFLSHYDNSSWAAAENLGYPVNSAADDISFVRSSDSLYGYLASSRIDSKGRFDIYQIRFNEIITYPPPPSLFVNLKGFLRDSKNGEPLKAIIYATDPVTGQTFTFDESDECSGEYRLNLKKGTKYNIEVVVPGYVSHNQELVVGNEAKEEDIALSVGLRRLEIGTQMVLENVFYDLNMATLADSSYAALDKVVDLLIKYPETRMEISAHTDSRGRDAFNQKLSEMRAQTCMEYLLSQGINEDMLVARGYGEMQLLITDEEIEALTEEEQEVAHQKNRRTEFKVIK
jgi:outer membrane protein OmpA-like peptidoglycan-associated protein/tetratricopeptide (TPR) repeat protein